MKVGKPYWEIKIRKDSDLNSMPWKEYQPLQKAKRAEAAKILGNRFEFATEKQAIAAKKKLPEHLQEWAEIRELLPISLGLGWC